MRKLTAIALTAAALSAAPLAAAPAQADETHVCSIFADPYDTPCQIVFGIICDQPFPPLAICR